MKDLANKKIFVTGGSRGIGAGIATHLASLGARVALSYSSNEAAADDVLSKLSGSGHFKVKLDLSNTTSVETAFAEVLGQFGQLDGLVNNGGITKDNLILRMNEEAFDTVIATNLRGTFTCIRIAAKAMLKARSGSIVNITSVVGQMGNAGQANYAASKGGVEAMAKSVAKELGSRNIRVNCVAPGYIATDMTAGLDDKQKSAMTEGLCIKRLGEPSDIAHATAFLLSDVSSYITGQTISVNGGLHM